MCFPARMRYQFSMNGMIGVSGKAPSDDGRPAMLHPDSGRPDQMYGPLSTQKQDLVFASGARAKGLARLPHSWQQSDTTRKGYQLLLYHFVSVGKYAVPCSHVYNQRNQWCVRKQSLRFCVVLMLSG
jgi:hypothetical protein